MENGREKQKGEWGNPGEATWKKNKGRLNSGGTGGKGMRTRRCRDIQNGSEKQKTRSRNKQRKKNEKHRKQEKGGRERPRERWGGNR